MYLHILKFKSEDIISEKNNAHIDIYICGGFPMCKPCTSNSTV